MTDALTELRAKYAGAPAEDAPRVISIRTRQAYEPAPSEKPKRVRRPKVDKVSVEALEDLLARMKAGEVLGFVGLVTERSDGSFTMFANLPPGEKPETAALRHVGGLELMKLDLMEIADFGLEGAPDDVIVIDGETP